MAMLTSFVGLLLATFFRRSAGTVSIVEGKQVYSAQFKVRLWHLDQGCHANWLIQLAIAQMLHHEFRNKLGFGLKYMKEKHDLFLLMKEVLSAKYMIQLRRGDVIDVELSGWIVTKVSLEFRCIFKRAGKVATIMNWKMPLVSSETGDLAQIPDWMESILGPQKGTKST